MDRFTERFGNWEEFPEMLQPGEWSPMVDFLETKDAWVVKAEIPGIDPKEIEVSLQNETLTMKGTKELEREAKEEQYHRRERGYGAFVRTLRLPAAVDSGGVTATFKNGLLTVMLPKAPGTKASHIPVKVE